MKRNIPYEQQLNNKIIDALKVYFSAIYNMNEFGNKDLPAMLLNISDIFCFIPERQKEAWLQKILIIIKRINEIIRAGGYNSIGLFGGLGKLAYSISAVCDATGHFTQIKNQLDNELFQRTKSYLDFCNNNIDRISSHHFDIINGLSGVINYIATNTEQYSEKFDLYKNIMSYFELILENYTYKGIVLPRWHIKHENLRHLGKDSFEDGNLNFSFSHGIAGPLCATNSIHHALEKNGISVEAANRIITKICSYYEKYGMIILRDNAIHWPGYLSPKSYNRGFPLINDVTLMPSWCYGNWSISWVIYNSAIATGDVELANKMHQNIINSVQVGCKYNTPVVCHGYAGNLIMQISLCPQMEEVRNELLRDILMYNTPGSLRQFNGLQDENGNILTGLSGIISALIFYLKGQSYLENLLMVKYEE